MEAGGARARCPAARAPTPSTAPTAKTAKIESGAETEDTYEETIEDEAERVNPQLRMNNGIRYTKRNESSRVAE